MSSTSPGARVRTFERRHPGREGVSHKAKQRCSCSATSELDRERLLGNPRRLPYHSAVPGEGCRREEWAILDGGAGVAAHPRRWRRRDRRDAALRPDRRERRGGARAPGRSAAALAARAPFRALDRGRAGHAAARLRGGFLPAPRTITAAHARGVVSGRLFTREGGPRLTDKDAARCAGCPSAPRPAPGLAPTHVPLRAAPVVLWRKLRPEHAALLRAVAGG